MCLIISFQSQEEDRGGSQFRAIALTGERLSAQHCPEVKVLEWICATSAEVEIIGDACSLGGCTLFSLPGKLHICLAPGCVEPPQEPQSEPIEQTNSTEFGHEKVCPRSRGGPCRRSDRPPPETTRAS